MVILFIFYLAGGSITAPAFVVWAAQDPHGAMQALQNVGHAFYGGIAPFAQRYLTGALGFFAGMVTMVFAYVLLKLSRVFAFGQHG